MALACRSEPLSGTDLRDVTLRMILPKLTSTIAEILKSSPSTDSYSQLMHPRIRNLPPIML